MRLRGCSQEYRIAICWLTRHLLNEAAARGMARKGGATGALELAL